MLDERLPSSDLCSTTPDDLAEGTQETTAAGEPRSTTNVLAELAQLTAEAEEPRSTTNVLAELAQLTAEAEEPRSTSDILTELAQLTADAEPIQVGWACSARKPEEQHAKPVARTEPSEAQVSHAKQRMRNMRQAEALLRQSSEERQRREQEKQESERIIQELQEEHEASLQQIQEGIEASEFSHHAALETVGVGRQEVHDGNGDLAVEISAFDGCEDSKASRIPRREQWRAVYTLSTLWMCFLIGFGVTGIFVFGLWEAHPFERG